MNVRWKVDSGENNFRQGSLKRQVFAIIGSIITKRSSVAFVTIIFVVVARCASVTLYNRPVSFSATAPGRTRLRG